MRASEIQRTRALGRAACVAVALALFPSVAHAGDTEARISGHDALAKATRAAKLRAKLEGKGMLGVFSDVEGELLDFWLVAEPSPGGKPAVAPLEKEKFLGSGKTDSSGTAELEWTAGPSGHYEVEARVRKGSKYAAVPATLEVLVVAADRPLVLATIEETLTDLGALNFMRKDAKDVAAVEGAADALGKVSEKHEIVYMTGIEEVSLVKTKDWLRLRAFPRGPVFFWNISQNAMSGEKFKTGLVAKLRADFSGITSGVGGRAEDVNACLKSGVTAYLLGGPDAEKAPLEALRVKQWDRLPAAIERQHEVEARLADLAAADAAKQEAGAKGLAGLGTPELGYLNRFLRSPDVSLGAAARLVLGRVRARDAFASSLDTSSDSTTLASLVAAWRAGDDMVTARLYREGAAGLAKAGPAIAKFRGIEVVNRSEPEPGKVVYRLRFLNPEKGGENAERDFVFLRGDDGVFRVDAGDV